MRLVIRRVADTQCAVLDTQCAVLDTDAPAALRNLIKGTYLECCEYVQEHSPKDLSDKMCAVLNSHSGPAFMGEPVAVNDCPATDSWNCKYCNQTKTCTLHSATPDNTLAERRVGKHPALAAPYNVGGYEGERNVPTPASTLIERYRAEYPDVYAVFQAATLTGGCPPPKEVPARSQEAHLLQVELNSTGPENPLRQRKLNRFELAALEWWRARRPVDRSSVEHVINPTINTHTAAEAKMAAMAAELFMQACEVGQLTFEVPVQP